MKQQKELDAVQQKSVIPGEQGIMSRHGRGFHFPSPFAKKHLYYLVWSDEYDCSPGYVVDRESLPCFMLMNLIKGKMRVTVNGKTFLAESGSLVLLNLNHPHCYQAETDLRVQQFMLNGNALPAYFNLLSEKQKSLVFHRDSKLSFLLSGLKKETMAPVPDDHLISMVITEILYALISGYQTDSSDPVRHAMYFITDHYKENISLDDIAGAVSLSKFYFSRLFEKETGYTPWEYLTEIRMRNAMHVLTHTNVGIEAIAENCGFSSAAHFIRAFRNYSGFTPGAFRRHFLEAPMGIDVGEPPAVLDKKGILT
ncbi:MAG: helix-turn-helix transcriptional regulator [Blautia sp.]|nr:helix-turn-helix transcriptional regulator [Blautia sp.]